MAILASFEEEELDRWYTDTAKTGVHFETGIVGNGKAVQQRNANRYDALRTYDINYGGMSQAEQTRLLEFFIRKQGRAKGFRFYPPFDREFQGDIIGAGDGTNKIFYLKRNYKSRDGLTTRRILKPIHPLLTITVDAQKVIIADPDGDIIPDGDFPILDNPITVDWNAGKIAFATAPALGQLIKVETGEFDVPVYFDTDTFGAEDFGNFANSETIRLVEIPPVMLSAEGNEISTCSLGFVTPMSNAAVPMLFDVSFTSVNLTGVSLYANGIYIGTSAGGPTFPFLDVERPVTESNMFMLEAVGGNNTGGFCIARITLMGGIDEGGLIYRGNPLVFKGEFFQY